MFKLQAKTGTGLKILTSKQMLQRLPIALAQVKAGNNSENLLNKIRQIVCCLYQSKQITKKVFKNVINRNNGYNIYELKNSKTSKKRVLILKLLN